MYIIILKILKWESILDIDPGVFYSANSKSMFNMKIITFCNKIIIKCIIIYNVIIFLVYQLEFSSC